MRTQQRNPRRTPDIASTLVQPADTSFREQERREAESRQALERKIEAVVEDGRRRMRDLFGARKHAEVRAAIQGERLALRNLRQPPEGLLRDPRPDILAGRRRIEALVRKHGVNPADIRKVQDETGAKVRALLAPGPENSVAGYRLADHMDDYRRLVGSDYAVGSDLTVAPPRDDPNDPHRWIPFTPPFLRCHAHKPTSFNPDEFAFDWTGTCNVAGLIGSEMTWDKSDTGENDMIYAYMRNEIEILYTPPISGRVEVAIVAQCVRDLYQVSFTDEFGFSSATAFQENRLYLSNEGVISAPILVMSNETTDEDPPMNSDKLIVGEIYYGSVVGAHVATNTGPRPIRIGHQNFTRLLTDDMAVHCHSNFMWQIRSIAVRIAH